MKKIRLLAMLLCALLAVSLAACAGDGGTGTGDGGGTGGDGGGTPAQTEERVDPPAPINAVNSVLITYGGSTVNGVLQVGLSLGAIELDADVSVTGEPSYTLAFSGDNPTVATVGGKTVTLLSAGETVITAAAADRKHEIVLVVADDMTAAPVKYPITVNGGTANAASAAAGEYVTVTAEAAPLGRIFKEWEYSADDLWVNGNLFRMPDGPIEITAQYDKLSFGLKIGNASVTVNDEPVDETPNDSGEIDIVCDYDDEITLTADIPTGKRLVGWDRNIENNRVKDEGGQLVYDEEITFNMPAEPQAYWAVSMTKSGLLGVNGTVAATGILDASGNAGTQLAGGSATAGSVWNSPAYATINASTDSDLEGMSGLTVNIPANGAANTHNRIRGSALNNVTVGGSVTLTYIFKNRSTAYDVTISIGAESYGAVAMTGNVTVPKNGGVVKKHVVVPHGFYEPYFILVLGAAPGGTGTIPLDIVADQAVTYRRFDPALEVRDPVQLGSWSGNFVRPDNQRGIMLFYGENFGVGTNFSTQVTMAQMPALAPGKTTTTVYFRMISYIGGTLGDMQWTVRFGTANNNGNFGSQAVTLHPNETQVFAVEIDRSTDPQTIYFSVVSTLAVSRQCFLIQMSYANVFGIEE
ncbi:MAG: hypothetical protein LBL66_10155 [Clostridiales bacterium]|jgi:hypothetical protein|nr:hypothetical protein [Clostridiales bacterium]